MLCSGAILALACGTAVAADPGGGPTHRTVYQQRLPDGTILLTDRIPYGGEDNLLEQSWTFPAEDPSVQAAEIARRAEARAAHDAVNERLNRMIVHRDRLAAEVEMERVRQAGARDWLEAERERHDLRPRAVRLQRP